MFQAHFSILPPQRYDALRSRLLRTVLPFCDGFVTAPTSISIPFYRDVTAVTASKGGEHIFPAFLFP